MMIKVPSKKNQEGFTLVELMIVVAIIGILAVLAIYGVSKYMTNAKTAEARNALGMIGKAAVGGYEQERATAALLTPGVAGSAVNHALCMSAQPVPGALTAVSNQKYQSITTDWFPTGERAHIGWTCLKFSITEPQYFQYGYQSDSAANAVGTGFVAWAESNLSGTGNASTLSFELKGALSGGQVVVAPQIDELNGPATKTIGAMN